MAPKVRVMTNLAMFVAFESLLFIQPGNYGMSYENMWHREVHKYVLFHARSLFYE